MEFLTVITETGNAGIARSLDITRICALRNSGKTLENRKGNLSVRNMSRVRVQKEKDRKLTNLSVITAVMDCNSHFRHSETHRRLVIWGLTTVHHGKRKYISKQPGLL